MGSCQSSPHAPHEPVYYSPVTCDILKKMSQELRKIEALSPQELLLVQPLSEIFLRAASTWEKAAVEDLIRLIRLTAQCKLERADKGDLKKILLSIKARVDSDISILLLPGEISVIQAEIASGIKAVS